MQLVSIRLLDDCYKGTKQCTMVLVVLLKKGAKDFTVKSAEGKAKLPLLGPGGHLFLVLLRQERVEETFLLLKLLSLRQPSCVQNTVA